MKNKLPIIVFVLCLPILTQAYYSSEQFRLDVMDSIRSNSQQEAIDRLREQNSNDFKQIQDSMNRSYSNIDAEYKYKLRELELREASQKRDEAWQKEKALLDKELNLIRMENELRKKEDTLNGSIKSGIDWDSVIKEGNEQVEKSQKLDIIKNKTNPVERKSLESIFGKNSSSTEVIVGPTPKRVSFFRHVLDWFKK